MPIHFDSSRWNDIRKTYDLWWNHKLDRPLLSLKIYDAYKSDDPPPRAPFLAQHNCNNFDFSAEELVDAMDYELQKWEYLGDSFPCVSFTSFGPGVLAAFCGAKLDNSSGGVWFFPEKELPIEEIHVNYNPENKWAKRLKDIYRAGVKKWNGNVLMSMTDLGGIMDVAATFRTSEGLLMDHIDNPDQVIRLSLEIQNAWHEAFNDLNSVLQPGNPGYSDWDEIYSASPSYILQSDFSYMTGPDMFRDFTLPLLKKDCQILDHTIYHLDGIGQIPHLDMLLSIKELDAIQWVFGDGKPRAPEWIDLYKRIEKAEKGIHVAGSPDEFLKVYSQVKNGLYYNASFSQKDRSFAEKLLETCLH